MPGIADGREGHHGVPEGVHQGPVGGLHLGKVHERCHLVKVKIAPNVAVSQSWAFGVCGSAVQCQNLASGQSQYKKTHFLVGHNKITYPW